MPTNFPLPNLGSHPGGRQCHGDRLRPQVYHTGSYHRAACQNLANSVGCEIYFDIGGGVVIARPVDIDGCRHRLSNMSRDHACIMTDLPSDFSDQPGTTAVIVTGAPAADDEPPVGADAWHYETSSPTDGFGSYG